jgi:hypothetical protein
MNLRSLILRTEGTLIFYTQKWNGEGNVNQHRNVSMGLRQIFPANSPCQELSTKVSSARRDQRIQITPKMFLAERNGLKRCTGEHLALCTMKRIGPYLLVVSLDDTTFGGAIFGCQ